MFKCYFTVFFWVQFYSPSTSVNTILHHYHTVLKFCQMNCVLEGIGIFRALVFGKYFLGFLSVVKYFLGPSEIQNSSYHCL